MNPNAAQIKFVAIIFALGAGFAAYGLHLQPELAALAAGLLAVLAVSASLFAGGAAPQDLGAVADGVRRARRGDRPIAPSGAGPDVSRLFDELSRIAEEEE